MYNILIVDISNYKEILADIFRKKNYTVTTCESAFEAISKIKAFDYDLIISEVELPGDNAFDLYNYLQNNYPYIPTIMVTDKNIDIFFNKIFEEGIGNVVTKPVNTKEILNLADKLITKKNIFDLHNYIDGIVETKKIRITQSKQIQKAIVLILDQIEKWNFEITNKMLLNLVLNEMTINAIYHSHGLTKEKEARIQVTLPEGEYVELYFGHNNEKYGIAINDYNGLLTKSKILDTINKVVIQSKLMEESIKNGNDITQQISETGRGLDLVRKLSGEYYFIIKQNTRTEIILLFDNQFTLHKENFNSSLKIIEDDE